MGHGRVGVPPRLAAPVPPGYVLPAGMTALLVIGAAAAAAPLGATGLLAAAAAVVLLCAAAGGVASAAAIAGIGWLVVSAFAQAPYGQLQPRGHAPALVLVLVGLCGLLGGAVLRARWAGPERTLADMAAGWAGASLGRRRWVGGLLLAAVLLPLVTVLLVAGGRPLGLADDLLLYLLVAVLVTLVGGLWSALPTALGAVLLVNWWFVPPFYTLTVDQPQNLLALVLFVAVAVSVSSVVHLAAGRQAQAHASRRETDALLSLAQAVFAGADTPAGLLAHLRASLGLPADLVELAAGRWVTVAAAGAVDLAAVTTVVVRDGLLLRVSGAAAGQERLIAAFAAQAAAALDRDRLRAQAAQAEALAAGNQMRTALLAAVSHDLRTPLASVKAAVSSLRQDDVVWSRHDEAELLATIEHSADRLEELIGNLLDMSRLQAGALRPYLHDTSLEEVVPLALLGLDQAATVVLDLPEDVPPVRTDPGLLERVLANLLANALRFSPPGRPPEVRARSVGSTVRITVADHGPGVPAGDRQRIFEPFQRLGDAGAGTGLGLAVAKGFCEAMGIPIDVEQTPGGGLSMTLGLAAARGVGGLVAAPPAVRPR